eukprot:3925972-Heterocapsa_arctica.AAC.1
MSTTTHRAANSRMLNSSNTKGKCLAVSPPPPVVRGARATGVPAHPGSRPYEPAGQSLRQCPYRGPRKRHLYSAGCSLP